MDLDQFKHVNDSLGHVAGDQMLREVAARFERCLGKKELLARMGGDEFTLLLPEEDLTDAAGSEAKAEALLAALSRPLVIEGHELHIAASIGISRFPGDGADAETLLKHADLAMYQAKERGRGQWQKFSPAMTEAAQERLILEGSLRKAIEREELVLLYQPQVSLDSGSIIGTEALVRWQHPEKGLIAPSRFIPLAEETGPDCAAGEVGAANGLPSSCLLGTSRNTAGANQSTCPLGSSARQGWSRMSKPRSVRRASAPIC